MKKAMMFIVIIGVVCYYSTTLAQINHAPVVENVVVTQRTDGTMKVDITYDVSDAENDTLTITMEVSQDGGTTWDFAANQVAGDVGANITPGSGKAIVWDFYAEHPEIFGENFKVRITADDGVASFTCGSSTVAYAGKTYNTVQIGDQCWLKENLDVGTMIASYSGSDNQTDNGIIEKYCYNNDPNNCTTYGGLYQWNEAMQYTTQESAQGICPDGWHIPTYSEFQTLCNGVGNSSNALKAIGQGTGTNTSGFSTLLAGIRSIGMGDFDYLGYYTTLWGSTENSTVSAGGMSMYNDNDDVDFTDDNKNYGFSVRCVKDSEKIHRFSTTP